MLFLPRQSIIYNQTWEDPYVDAEALHVREDDVVVALASGGCNILNTALQKPKMMHAVDQNSAQIALLSLKIAGARSLPYDEYWECFGIGRTPRIKDFYSKMRSMLSDADRKFWDSSLEIFSHGLYCTGRLKTLYTLGYWIRKTCPENVLQDLIQIEHIPTQRELYFSHIKPRLWRFSNTYIPSVTMCIYGVSWRQILRFVAQGKFFLKDLFEKRIDTLFTSVLMRDNYFWHRIFFGKYLSQSLCPLYLQKENFTALGACVDRISTHTSTMIGFLRTQKESSITVFNLADLPEFLSATERKELWNEVARTACPQARVLYRTVTAEFPAPFSALARFAHNRDASIALSAKEMTGSYAEVLLFRVEK